MPIPSAGRSDREKERREHDERAARNARHGEREEDRGEGDRRQAAACERNAVEPADEERADVHDTGAAILNVETASGRTKPVTSLGDIASPRSALSTSAGSDAIDELELNAMSCDGSAARREAPHRNAGRRSRRPDRAAA